VNGDGVDRPLSCYCDADSEIGDALKLVRRNHDAEHYDALVVVGRHRQECVFHCCDGGGCSNTSGHIGFRSCYGVSGDQNHGKREWQMSVWDESGVTHGCSGDLWCKQRVGHEDSPSCSLGEIPNETVSVSGGHGMEHCDSAGRSKLALE